MASPKIRITGVRNPIPQGYILGRASLGTGDIELIPAPGLAAGQVIPTQPAGGPPVTKVLDKNVEFSDNTTGNASTTEHGFLPKLPGNASEYLDGSGHWSTPSGTGGPSPAPAMRGVTFLASQTGSFTLSWPTGTAAGDLAIAFYGHTWPVNLPAGWTYLDNQDTGSWNGAIMTHVVTAADITAGNVTITTQGSFGQEGAIGLVTFAGLPDSLTFVKSTHLDSSNPLDLGTPGNVTTNDMVLAWGSVRTNTLDTISGTNIGTQLGQGRTGNSGSGVLNGGYATSVAPVAASFSYAGSSTNYQALVVLHGAAGGVPDYLPLAAGDDTATLITDGAGSLVTALYTP